MAADPARQVAEMSRKVAELQAAINAKDAELASLRRERDRAMRGMAVLARSTCIGLAHRPVDHGSLCKYERHML